MQRYVLCFFTPLRGTFNVATGEVSQVYSDAARLNAECFHVDLSAFLYDEWNGKERRWGDDVYDVLETIKRAVRDERCAAVAFLGGGVSEFMRKVAEYVYARGEWVINLAPSGTVARRFLNMYEGYYWSQPRQSTGRNVIPMTPVQ